VGAPPKAGEKISQEIGHLAERMFLANNSALDFYVMHDSTRITTPAISGTREGYDMCSGLQLAEVFLC